MHLNVVSFARTLLMTGALAGMALAATPSHAQDDAPPRAARLAHLQGNVSIQSNGQDNWGQASENMPIGAGDRVYTDQQAQGELQVGQVRAYFAANSDITLVNANQQGIELGIAQGSSHIFSDGFPQDQSLFVSTPNGGLTIAGRAEFRLDVYPDQQSTVVTNYQGAELALNGAGGFNMILAQGQSVQLSGTNPVYTQQLAVGDNDAFLHWSGAIESHRFNSVSSRYVSTEMAGYDELDNSGDWQPESDYGPIWFPRVEAGWAPYHNGHWVNRPFYGWTWVEDEPWGAAPFHYGRWVQMGGRWGWIPGPREGHPVWSPAQVVFAGGIQIGGVGVSAWFPLGPGEAYHPWYPASPEYINRINITNIRESRVVHVQNTYITNVNITNVTYMNRTVGVTAMRQEDFAAGHSARAVAVKVDPRMVEHVQPARPEARPLPTPVILHPVARPAAVAAARPVLINHQGQQVTAAPNARPVAVPVKTAPPVVRPIPGHTAIGTPTVAGKPLPPSAAQPNRPAQPLQPTQPARPTQGVAPVPPARTQPTAPVPAPAPDRGAAPTRPLPPAARPVQPQPVVKPQPVAPAARPLPPPPVARPVPPVVKPVAPSARPVTPAGKPVPPAKDAKGKDNKKDKRDEKPEPK
jgi:hypothetical protein